MVFDSSQPLESLVPKLRTTLRSICLSDEQAKAETRLLLNAIELNVQQRWLTPEHTLTANQRERLDDLIARRITKREPIQYILEEAWFWGQPFRVSPSVLIPRPETEELIRLAEQKLTGIDTPTTLDVGTGSGCIAITLKTNNPSWTVWASDLSTEALRVAKRNADHHKAAVHWREGSLLTPIDKTERFDLIISNLPYVDRTLYEEELQPEVLQHEPDMALFAEDKGLALLQSLIQTAPKHLNASGWILLEIGQEQGPAVKALLDDKGFETITLSTDLSGRMRYASAQWKGG